jgi:hypothetical protein
MENGRIHAASKDAKRELGMLMTNSNNGGPGPELWCVELVPKPRRITMDDARRAVHIARGTPRDADEEFVWVVHILAGSGDERRPLFARERQRLVVFENKRDAAERARRKTNEFWTGKVRAVKFICTLVGESTDASRHEADEK